MTIGGFEHFWDFFDSYDNIICTVLSLISAAVSFWLLHSFFSLPQKPNGLKMIAILSVSDLIYHTVIPIQIWSYYAPKEPVFLIFHRVVQIIGYSAQRFSILWAAAIFVLVYRTFTRRYQEKDLRHSIVIVIILSITFALM